MPAHGPMGKLIKKCFKPYGDNIIWSSDYSSLQGYTGADLTKDKALLQIYRDTIDLHAYMTCRYWPEEFDKDHPETREYYEWVKDNYGELRQKSKAVTFALQFGAGPSKIAKTLKVDYDEGKRLYDAYHNTYAGVAKFAKETLKFAEEHGYVELGHHGLRLQTPSVTKEARARLRKLRETYMEAVRQQKQDEAMGKIPQPLTVTEKELQTAEAIVGGTERSLVNARTQYLDINTLQALFKFQNRIHEAGLDSKVVPHATIYDSIYGECHSDVETVEWVNNTLIYCMVGEPYAPYQTLKLRANLDIGPSWADLHELPNNASCDEIKEALSNL